MAQFEFQTGVPGYDYALNGAANVIKFVAQVLMTLGINAKLPINVYVDHIGAMFMVENFNTSSRTCHCHIC